jgi:NAD(P)-dependent dehydrogenase (short-subunit alcohol dehydrogenase family)
VVLADIDGAAAVTAAGALRAAGHEAAALGLDVTDEPAVEAALTAAAGTLGGLDVVVANAGILSVASLDELDGRAFSRVIDVNLLGTFLTLRHATPHLRAAGGGVLLCTASQAGTRGYPRLSAYCASKFGVVGLVQALAQELAPDGIRVCCVAPGMVETPMLHLLIAPQHGGGGDGEDPGLRVRGATPLGRPARPEEVADGLVYLASPLAAYVSGITLTIDGGELSG